MKGKFLAAYIDDMIPELFWPRVCKRENDCWIWQGSINKSTGYGRFSHSRTEWRAHRLAWILTNGTIPNDLFVCHKCDVRLCCNPSHLFLGTPADNTADRGAKGRTALPKGERHPMHRLTDNDILEIRKAYIGGALQRDIAEQYGVSRPNISLIVHGKNWGHIDGSVKTRSRHHAPDAIPTGARLTPENVREIREAFQCGDTLKAITARYDVSLAAIRLIVKRITWKHID